MQRNNLFLILVLLGIAVILLVIGFYLLCVIQFNMPLTKRAVYFIHSTILIIVLVLAFVCRKLYIIEKREMSRDLNTLYFDHLQELLRVIRLQRHDFVNHMQVIYALLQTRQIEKAEEYITGLGQRVQISKEMLQIQIPELAALLLVKMGVAALKNISFDIEAESDLKSLRIDPIDLNIIIGNLVDNAFEAVENLGQEQKKVVLRLSETSESYFIQTINPGYLDRALREKIFCPGFSSKQGLNRGFGLASVKSAVEKYRGKINVASSEEDGVRFTVMLPKRS